MREIKLWKNKDELSDKVSIVDEEDYDRVVEAAMAYRSNGTPYGGKWYAKSSTSGKFYAMNGSRNRSIHRFIMNFPKGMDVDHINGDALDNRKENLRICTRSENCRNKKVRSDSKSGYKGVHQRPPNGRYQAYIGDPTRKGRHMYLGHHDSAEEAARAYDKKAIELHGEFASLNFPKDKQE